LGALDKGAEGDRGMSESDPAELRRTFQRDGFAHVKGLLSKAEIVRFRKAVDDAVAARKVHDTRPLADKTPYEQSFIQCQYMWEDFPDIRPLTFHQAITGMAATLLGAPAVRLWHDQALYKEAGGRETDAHQDHPYWPIVEDDTLTAWVPLVPATETTGCMGYVAGSHRGPREFVDIFTTPGSGDALLEKLKPSAPVFVPAEPGDVLFHHGFTAHTAKPNRSSDTRRVYTAIYFKDGAHRSETPKHHPSVDRAAIAVGAAIDSPVTPVAYPIAGENWPTPMPWPDTGSGRIAMLRKMGVIPTSVRHSDDGRK
jgi:ectoine hydroxylase-related dioxygenase (phytanoyl-CoA dioxygenase family)